MKIFCALLLFLNSLLFANVPKAVVAEIKLTGSRDKVLSFEQRSIVLEVADIYLNRSDEFFTASLEGLKNPYASKPDLIGDEELKIEKTATVYDTASILEVIGANFARQVRGTLSKGGIDYLQLQGGSLLAADDVAVAYSWSSALDHDLSPGLRGWHKDSFVLFRL